MSDDFWVMGILMSGKERIVVIAGVVPPKGAEPPQTCHAHLAHELGVDPMLKTKTFVEEDPEIEELLRNDIRWHFKEILQTLIYGF